MKVRLIDGNKLIDKLHLIAACWSISPFVSKEKHNGAVDMLREVEREVKESTLTSSNEPLTLEELRGMDGVNALWLHNLTWGLHKPRLMLVRRVVEDWWSCCDFNGFETFSADNYGDEYLLYRRPPEGEEKI